ncbi:MAG TPA: tetratricopeptide repeat protein [Ignavibacteria bacterium]|nr:tetratricopeptide repeat protein [Ignavibacteria bacterium]HRJ98926.1 tetratricopeptide repeat protein [Ignavibacteria bacterium]
MKVSISKNKEIALLSCIFCMILLSGNLYSQQDIPKTKTDRDKALNFFIEGKTLELKYDYIGAVENYRNALKFDKSSGIYYSLAVVYYKLNKFDEALTEIKNALKLKPDDQDYLETSANIYIVKKDFLKAIAAFERIIKLDSNYTYGLYSLARLYQETQMPANALAVYEKITNKIGYDFDVLNKMYEIYMKNKDYDKAADVLENMLKIDPFNAEMKKILANLYLNNKNYEKAKLIYENILSLDHNEKGIQNELVKIYFKLNENDKAFDNFSKVLGKDSLNFLEKIQIGELYFNLISQDETAKDISKNIFTVINNSYPEEWIPYYYLGVFELMDKNVVSYNEYFDKALMLADTTKDVFVNIGFSFYQEGLSEEAISVLDKGLSVYPEDFRMNFIKGLVLQGSGNEKDAVKYYETALISNPGDINTLSSLALIYDNQKQYEKSTETYEKALKIDPYNALILNNYAYNLSERDTDLEKALKMAKIAVEKEPDNASYLDTIGWIYFKMKKYKLAEEFIGKSLQINPNSAVVLEHMGDVYNKMKNNAKALKYWKMSLEINPSNENLRGKISNVQIG